MKTEVTYRPTIEAIEKAALNLKEVALKTPLVKNDQYSQKYQVFNKSCVVFCLASSAACSLLDTQEVKNKLEQATRIRNFFIIIFRFKCYSKL